MYLSAHDSCHSLVVLCILLRSCQAFKNDATELLFSHVSAPAPQPEVQSNVTLNRARNGGRGGGEAAEARGRGGECASSGRIPLFTVIIIDVFFIIQ